MPIGLYSADVDAERVAIHRGGKLVATGRWTGTRIAAPAWVSEGDRPADEEAVLEALASRIAEQAAAEVAAMQSCACDASGVDLTAIRWMLGLSPRDRLRVLRDHARCVAAFVDDRHR